MCVAQSNYTWSVADCDDISVQAVAICQLGKAYQPDPASTLLNGICPDPFFRVENHCYFVSFEMGLILGCHIS